MARATLSRWTSTSRPGSPTTYALEPVGGATVVTLRNTGTPSGFAGVAAPVMAAAMHRANAKDLAALKQMVEAV